MTNRVIPLATAATIVALAFGTSALAQEEMVFSPAVTEACLFDMAEGADPATCVGASANACMDSFPGGSTTPGMAGCFFEESKYWDGRLNASYKKVKAKAEAIDTEMQEIGSSAASQADALRDMQRAWITFRDKTCEYEYSLWGGGTGGGPAINACHMHMNAKQALYLESLEGLN